MPTEVCYGSTSREGVCLGSKPATSPMEVRPNFWDNDTSIPEDVNKYRHLIGKLLYLTVSDLIYPMFLSS